MYSLVAVVVYVSVMLSVRQYNGQFQWVHSLCK